MANGIVNVYKEKGFTSFDVVAKMRGIFHQKKIGHTGTLDPDAEGVLPVCLGKATKVCELLTDKDKEYEAILFLGQKTDTQDISGAILETAEVTSSEKEVEEAILSFIGTYQQTPPMYSALKVNGQKLCDLARQGIVVERKSRPVTIHNITIIEMNLPEVRMRVSCSKGTYIRTLCEDIGEKLGCFGCMKALLRTKVSVFNVEEALTLAQLEELVKKPESEWEFLHSVDSLFTKYPKAVAPLSLEKLVINGNRVPAPDLMFDEDAKNGASEIRLYDWNDRFIGIYRYLEEEQCYKPVKLFME